jgi:hypothetical protein
MFRKTSKQPLHAGFGFAEDPQQRLQRLFGEHRPYKQPLQQPFVLRSGNKALWIDPLF